MTQNRAALLPCPFCGSAAERFTEQLGKYTSYGVRCSNYLCPICPDDTDTIDSFVTAHWNTRANNWNPDMSAAPRDGTSILACVKGAEPSICRYVSTPMGRSGWCTEYIEAFYDKNALEEYMTENSYQPNYWLPLSVLPPTPPEGSEK